MSASRAPKLTLEAIVGAAVELADREGLPAVSMRRVGGDLGYSGMSLYGYITSKEDLLDLMADHLLGEVPEVDTEEPWDVAIVDFFTALHDVLLEHPAVAQVFTLRPTRGPNTLRHGQQALAALAAGGLPGQVAVEAFIALSCYTIGAALYTAARETPDAQPDPRWVGFGDSDSPTSEDLHAVWEHLAARAGAEQFRSGLEHLVRGYAIEGRGTTRRSEPRAR